MRLLKTIAALFILTGTPCWAADVVPPGTATVKIENFTFNPEQLTIKPGTMVIWQNADDIPHTVVDIGGKFHSKPLDTDQSFSMTFKDAGEVAYFCGLHPHMKGKIVVKP
jgi:plastocyanin